MKFRFCGEGDCPDWVLAEIISTLSVLSASKMEQLAELVAKRIIGGEFEEDAIKSLTVGVCEDGKSAVACLHFLLINAVRHNASESVFKEEIQQLGLPKDHAAGVCRVLSAYTAQMRQRLIDKSFKINELASIRHVPPSEDDDHSTIDCSKFELQISQELVDGVAQDSTHVVNIENANVRALLEELTTARNIIAKYEEKND